MVSKHQPVLVEKSGLSKDNIILFADAIFAFAITLLVLDVRLPRLPAENVDALFYSVLASMFPQMFSFFLSFFVVTLFWTGYHHIMGYVRKLDKTMLWITIAFLFMIALIAFPTGLMGDYSDYAGPTILYQIMLAISSFLLFGMWKYASHKHRLIDDSLDKRIIGLNSVKALIPVVVFIATIPVSQENPSLAHILWVAIIPLNIAAKRFYGVESAKTFE